MEDIRKSTNDEQRCVIIFKHKPQASNNFSFIFYEFDYIVIKVRFNDYDKIGDILAKLAKSVVYNSQFEKMIWNQFEFATSEVKKIQNHVDGFLRMFKEEIQAEKGHVCGLVPEQELREVANLFAAAPNKPQLGHQNQLTAKNYMKLLNFIDNLTCRKYFERKDILEYIASWLSDNSA